MHSTFKKNWFGLCIFCINFFFGYSFLLNELYKLKIVTIFWFYSEIDFFMVIYPIIQIYLLVLKCWSYVLVMSPTAIKLWWCRFCDKIRYIFSLVFIHCLVICFLLFLLVYIVCFLLDFLFVHCYLIMFLGCYNHIFSTIYRLVETLSYNRFFWDM